MIWVLIATLLGGITQPFVVDRNTCIGVAEATAEGKIVSLHAPDGTSVIVLAAKCRAELAV